jgi:dihydropteroate synthase
MPICAAGVSQLAFHHTGPRALRPRRYRNYPQVLRVHTMSSPESPASQVQNAPTPSDGPGRLAPARQDRPLIMGVLNVTPDSFSDGGHFHAHGPAIDHAMAMQDEGADILDLGGESTRPGSSAVSADEEAARVMPVISALAARVSVPISIDTYKASTADTALSAGASIVNDVWGLMREPDIARVAASHGAPVVIGHWVPDLANETDDSRVMTRMRDDLSRCVEHALGSGVAEDRITLDPGIGFGKSPAQNLLILNALCALSELGFPLLVGTSRKSFIGYITGREPMDRLAGTIASNVLAANNGASILRVHDVAAHHDALRVATGIARGTMPPDVTL